jgi:hypothetical protein
MFTKTNNMKSIGSLMFILGVLAIVMYYLDRVPRLLIWIYNWGEGAAWAIKIGLVVVGAGLYILGSRNTGSSSANEQPPAQ